MKKSGIGAGFNEILTFALTGLSMTSEADLAITEFESQWTPDASGRNIISSKLMMKLMPLDCRQRCRRISEPLLTSVEKSCLSIPVLPLSTPGLDARPF
jgi:hypothetical protein